MRIEITQSNAETRTIVNRARFRSIKINRAALRQSQTENKSRDDKNDAEGERQKMF